MRSAQRRTNNFDLLRLVAAGQVALWHGIEHLQIPVPREFMEILGLFPGVAVFFVISGYLVSASLLRATSLRSYAINRVLRIFPALWICFLFAAGSALWFGHLQGVDPGRIAVWVAAQLSIVQFYNPDFLRGFGTGVLNGSLWTVPVELQFYVLLPLLLPFLRVSWRRQVVVLALASIAGVVYLYFRVNFIDALPTKLMLVTLPSWIYLFVIGMFLQLHQSWVDRFIRARAAYWLIAYLGAVFLARSLGMPVSGNDATPLTTPLLAVFVVSAAFTWPHVSGKLLRGNDVSYGLYLYHMPIVNILLQTGWRGEWSGLATALGLSAFAAIASWRLVERRALRMKLRFGGTSGHTFDPTARGATLRIEPAGGTRIGPA